MPVWISASALAVTLPVPVFFLLIQRLLVVLTQSCAATQSYSLAGRQCTLAGWGLFWCWWCCHWPQMKCAVGHLLVPGLQRSGLLHT